MKITLLIRQIANRLGAVIRRRQKLSPVTYSRSNEDLIYCCIANPRHRYPQPTADYLCSVNGCDGYLIAQSHPAGRQWVSHLLGNGWRDPRGALVRGGGLAILGLLGGLLLPHEGPEEVVRAYYALWNERNPADAQALLTSGLSSSRSRDHLMAAMNQVRALSVTDSHTHPAGEAKAEVWVQLELEDTSGNRRRMNRSVSLKQDNGVWRIERVVLLSAYDP